MMVMMVSGVWILPICDHRYSPPLYIVAVQAKVSTFTGHPAATLSKRAGNLNGNSASDISMLCICRHPLALRHFATPLPRAFSVTPAEIIISRVRYILFSMPEKLPCCSKAIGAAVDPMT